MLNRRTLLGAAGAGALLATTGIARAQDKLYIPLISKGFQHQFWQAVSYTHLDVYKRQSAPRPTSKRFACCLAAISKRSSSPNGCCATATF